MRFSRALHVQSRQAHGGTGEEYGSCVRENDGCRDSHAMDVSKEGSGGGPREAIPRVESWVVNGWSARVRVITESSQRAVDQAKVGESAPVVSVTSRVTG